MANKTSAAGTRSTEARNKIDVIKKIHLAGYHYLTVGPFPIMPIGCGLIYQHEYGEKCPTQPIYSMVYI